MKRVKLKYIGMVLMAHMLQGCTGILSSIYDDPVDPASEIVAGQLYIDASDWGKWHYIDLPAIAQAVAADSAGYNANSAWQSYDIPMTEIDNPDTRTGIYTYWYDVFGAGISVSEFRSFYPTAPQPEPDDWTFAVHRNNVRTHNCSVAATSYGNIDQLPENRSFLSDLTFVTDRRSENDVWCEQSKMLLGLIGNQGIDINPVLSSWLKVDIPPMPPAFTICSNVFIIKLPDNTYGALQLENYQSPAGTKCCLTINYRYPL